MMALEDKILKAIDEHAEELAGKRVAIQLPDGLKIHLLKIMEKLDSIGAFPLAIAEQTFGACDLLDEEAKKAGADLLLHFGHEYIYQPCIKTIFIPLEYDKLFSTATLKDLLKEAKGTVAVVGSVQYKPAIEQVKDYLKKKEVKLVENEPKGRIKSPTQLLGCNYISIKDSDTAIVIADGNFHALGAMYASANTRKIIVINPFDEKMELLNSKREKWIRTRLGLMALAQGKKRFGFMISQKLGQNRLKYAELLKRKMMDRGYEVFLILGNNLYPDKFLGLQLDVLVNFACPRIATDDWKNYKLPVLTVRELELLLQNDFNPEHYVYDELP
jgi:2-(3-amino-3-carboxypropyl)histidine synthase